MEKIPNLSNLKRLQYLDLSDSNRLVEVQGLENLKLTSLDMAGCNDLATTTTFNESFFQRYFERDDYDESNISLPKWNFQNWIIYQSMESTISFELPWSLPDNFQGIILWVVYAQFYSKDYNAHITNNTSGREWHHFRSSEYYWANKNCLGGQSWVSCIKSNFRSGDSIKISMSEDINVKVEKCGVHWLIGNEGDEDENVHYCNTTYNWYDDDCYPTESESNDDDNHTETDGGDGDDYEEETETTETETDDNLKRGHDFDLNTKPNEESSKRLRS